MRIYLVAALFCLVSLVCRAGDVVSGQFILAPAADVGAVVELLPGSGVFISEGLPEGSTKLVIPLTAGGASKVFRVKNSLPFSEAVVSVSYDGLSFQTHIDISVSADKPNWKKSSGVYPGDNPTILSGDSGSSSGGFILLNPTKPTGNGGGGIPGKYQVLNPGWVWLVDCNLRKQTYLFRGNLPFASPKATNESQEVDFKGLAAIMKVRALQCGVELPSLYVLRVISLQNRGSEGGSIQMELDSFDASMKVDDLEEGVWVGEVGKRQFMNFHVEPSVGYQANYTLVKTLVDLMGQQSVAPVVYYFHCASGHDRTGAVAVGYLSTLGRFSLSESFILGTTVAKLPATAGKEVRDCFVLGTENIDPLRSRMFLADDGFNRATLDIFNYFNPNKKSNSIPTDAAGMSPAYVIASFPWLRK